MKEVLTKQWGNMTAENIGKIIGRTRNAVIGKANRMGLKQLQKSKARNIGDGLIAFTIEHRAGVPTQPLEDTKTTKGIPAKDMRQNMCKWPTWGNRDKVSHEYCGKKCEKVYCEEHSKIAYRVDRPIRYSIGDIDQSIIRR